MVINVRTSVALLISGVLAGSALAQVGSLSETLSGKTEQGKYKLSFSATAFNDDESSLYGNIGFVYGFSRDFDIMLRGSYATRTTTGLVRTGGIDHDLQLVWRKDGLFASGGLSVPSTPAQDNVAAAFTVGFNPTLESGGNVFLGVSGVTSDDATLAGLGFAGSLPLKEGWYLEASAYLILRGDNTRDPNTGNSFKTDVYSFAVKYNYDERQTFWLSASTAVGHTTGFGLTHRLGNGLGIGAGFEVKF